jgi:hypothetical protein
MCSGTAAVPREWASQIDHCVQSYDRRVLLDAAENGRLATLLLTSPPL